ncbi:MAG: pilus assembly protein PilX [Burkholderiaceae bacterium]|jgi:type IV pilus assembly protein PilX|nr:pilus assembly protein PilX [Burkholderiaceae bacterium]
MRPHKPVSFGRAAIGRGIALPVVLLLLVLILVAAGVGIRRATLTEGLARNQVDVEIARQAAEAALRDAERDLRLPDGNTVGAAPCSRGDERAIDAPGARGEPYFAETCPRGQCGYPLSYYTTSNFAAGTNPQPWWPTANGGRWQNTAPNLPSTCATFTGGVPLGTFTDTPRVAGVARQPEYLIEHMGYNEDKYLFRITARGFGAEEATEVVLQTYFRARVTE